MKDKTTRDLQQTLPWGVHDYSAAFKARTDLHRDYQHALLHIDKARRALDEFLDAVEHNDALGAVYEQHREEAKRKLADILICTLRAANTFPGNPIDMQEAYDARAMEKFGAKP